MKRLITLSLAGAMALSVSACYTPGERAAGGALLGAGTGAAVGAATTGRAGGALVGGTLGAIGGAALGAATAPPPPPAGGYAPRLKCPRGTMLADDGYGNPVCV
jgi:osmotically inducible lipoprotein OsmB